jgi:predicted phosphodiesterase
VTANTLKMLIVSDCHAPYHDHAAWGCLLSVAEQWRPDVCVVLGDFADFAAVSSHPKVPGRLHSFANEVEYVNDALDELDAALKAGGCRTKEFLEGNHENRLSRYVAKQAPDLFEFVDWQGVLRLDQRAWRVTPYKSSIQYGRLRLTHDVGRAGVQAARQSRMDVGHSVAFGHCHSLQVSYGGTVSGERHVGATLGWLGDPEAIDYRHRDMVRREWQHGFGVAHFVASGEFWLQGIPVVKGRCVIDGRIYNG